MKTTLTLVLLVISIIAKSQINLSFYGTTRSFAGTYVYGSTKKSKLVYGLGYARYINNYVKGPQSSKAYEIDVTEQKDINTNIFSIVLGYKLTDYTTLCISPSLGQQSTFYKCFNMFKGDFYLVESKGFKFGCGIFLNQQIDDNIGINVHVNSLTDVGVGINIGIGY